MMRTHEAAFETVIEAHLLANGYVPVHRDGFDRERAIFPETVLAFIRETRPKEWAKLEALHGEKTGEQILGDLCKWMDANGALATLRHRFKCYGRTLHVKHYESEKTEDGDAWRHACIILKPVNPDFQPIELTGEEEGQVQVIAECIDVLGGGS